MCNFKMLNILDDIHLVLSPKCVLIKREPESPDHGLFKKKIKLEQ